MYKAESFKRSAILALCLAMGVLLLSIDPIAKTEYHLAGGGILLVIAAGILLLLHMIWRARAKQFKNSFGTGRLSQTQKMLSGAWSKERP